MQFFGLHIDASTQELFIIIGVSVVVWAIGVWLSYRKSKKNILLKSLLFLGCILSVDALVLQPHYNIKLDASTAILLTNEVDIEILKPRFENHHKYQFFKLPQVKSKLSDSSLIKTVANVNHLIQQYQPIDSVYIVGDNLPVHYFKNMPFVPLRFLPSKAESSNHLIEIKYPDKVKISEDFELAMKLELDSNLQKYVIESPFSQLDTVLISKDTLKINYKATCAIEGNHLIKFHFLDAQNTIIETFALPVEIIPKEKATILMLNGHPDFEHKHLKNWLAKQGHQLSVRTQISRQKFQFDRINQDKKNEAVSLNEAFLKTVDLLIIDGTALFTLAENEYQLIKRFHKKGMAMLFRTDGNILKAKDKRADFSFNIKAIAQSKRLFASVLVNNQLQEIEIYPYENTLFTSKRFKGKDAGKILSTNRKTNQLIGITNLQNSYLLNLKGDTTIYNSLWFTLIDEMLGTANLAKNTWQFKHAHPQISEAIDIILFSNEKQPLAFVKATGTLESDMNHWSPLYLQQHYLIAEKYEATFWANQPGWYQFKTEKDSSLTQLYIASKSENNLIRHRNKNLLKAKYIKQIQQREIANYETQNRYAQKLIPPIWNWLIFVICLSAIWIIEKFIVE